MRFQCGFQRWNLNFNVEFNIVVTHAAGDSRGYHTERARARNIKPSTQACMSCTHACTHGTHEFTTRSAYTRYILSPSCTHACMRLMCAPHGAYACNYLRPLPNTKPSTRACDYLGPLSNTTPSTHARRYSKPPQNTTLAQAFRPRRPATAVRGQVRGDPRKEYMLGARPSAPRRAPYGRVG